MPSPDAERRWGGGTAPEGRGGRGRAAEPQRFSGSQLQTLRKRMRSLTATDRLFCGLRGLFRQCADGALPPFLACRLGRRFCLRQRSPPATRAPTRLRRWGGQGHGRRSVRFCANRGAPWFCRSAGDCFAAVRLSPATLCTVHCALCTFLRETLQPPRGCAIIN